MARAIRLALSQAGLTADAIDHVNANGLSTISGDRHEAQALREVFGCPTSPRFRRQELFWQPRRWQRTSLNWPWVY